MENKVYKPSVYNLLIDFSADELLIFNTFSESLIKIEKSFYADFIKKLNYSYQDAELNSVKETFIKSGFIVEDDFDELTYIKIRNRQSRLLAGCDFAYSQKIFDYLDKAINMNPQLKDAIYFYEAECGAVAGSAMQSYDLEKARYFYQKAYEKGAFPPWRIEEGKNFMNTCDTNAILFTGGDADYNICMYLQLCQNYRTDLTIIPLGLLSRPWYIKFLKTGLGNVIKKININLTDEQIMDIRPFKWKTSDVYIAVSEEMKRALNLEQNFQFKWIVEPDLVQIEGEEVKERTYLSPHRAMLLQIVEDNFKERPIYFSCFAPPIAYRGLKPYFRYCGMTYQLLPVETENTDNLNNILKLEALFQAENFMNFPTVKTDNIPRVSHSVYSYYYIFITLAHHYKQTNQAEKLKKIIELYKTHIAIGYDEEYEAGALAWAEEALKQILE